MSSNICFDCKCPITSGEYVQIDDNHFHADHFRCSHCSTPFESNPYFEKDSSYFCEKDYHELFSPKCFKCKQPIKDKYLNIDGKNYHNTCFICAECNSEFENGNFLNYNGSQLCKKCYTYKAAKICSKCNEPILSKIYLALDKHWHADCFTCGKCGKKFNQESFLNIEGLPYHQACHQILCVFCSSAVSGEYYQLENDQALHKNCLDSYKNKKKNQPSSPPPEPESKPQPISQLQPKPELQVQPNPHPQPQTQPEQHIQPQTHLLGLPSNPKTQNKRSSVLVNALGVDLYVDEETKLNEDVTKLNISQYYSYERLIQLPSPEGVDQDKRENHLNDEEFQKVFGMGKEEFGKLSKWKKNEMKKKAKLF